MNMMKTSVLSVSIAMLLGILSGCASPSGGESEQVGLGAETAISARAGTVIVDGCVIDPWQRSTLARPSTKKVIQEVILLCLVPRLDGTIGPQDESAKRAITT